GSVDETREDVSSQFVGSQQVEADGTVDSEQVPVAPDQAAEPGPAAAPDEELDRIRLVPVHLETQRGRALHRMDPQTDLTVGPTPGHTRTWRHVAAPEVLLYGGVRRYERRQQHDDEERSDDEEPDLGERAGEQAPAPARLGVSHSGSSGR